MRWWLDRGVDGFRMDVINMISKSPGLPNAPNHNQPQSLSMGRTVFYLRAAAADGHLTEMKQEALIPTIR